MTRAILINDTRSDRHIGCQLVIDNTLKLCRENDISITHSITNADALDAQNLLAPHISTNDLILLNGEGTLHDDNAKTMALLQAAKTAKEAGLKTVLYNALWRNNNEANHYLPYFDLIYCRDSKSAQLVSLHTPCSMVPDMVFSTHISEEIPEKKKFILVTDSVKKQISRALARFAIRNRHSFAAMGPGFERSLKRHPIMASQLSRKCLYQRNYVDTPEEFIRKIHSAKGVVTGRFHTACISILCGSPVACIASNTSKIESLYKDFGLSAPLLPAADLSNDSILDQWQEQRQNNDSLRQKVAEAKQSIHKMFQSFTG